MNHYHHFNAFERQLIQIRAEEGNSLQSIADELHRSKSSVWREINRFPSSSYDAPAAQEQYFSNRRKCHQKRKLEDLDLSEFIQNCITEKHWSPEQIANRLKIEHAEWAVSYTTIYRGIYRDNLSVAKTAGQRGLARRLRHRGKTRHSKNYHERRGQFVIERALNERPEAADFRYRIGDWEADTIVGKTGGEVLVTLVDRFSRYLLVGRATSKKAADVTQTMRHLLNQVADEHLLTITPDRGKEFARHLEIEKEFDLPFYFPEPHSPWQRGTNENTNGLIREYFPKGQEIADFTDEYIMMAMNQINSRPRKTHYWHSAKEVYLRKTFHLV